MRSRSSVELPRARTSQVASRPPDRIPSGDHPAGRARASHRLRRRQTDAFAFTGPTGAAIRRGSLNKLLRWQQTVAAMGVPGLHFHDLRHIGNTLAAGTGASVRDLMARMGHDSPAAAMIYQHAISGCRSCHCGGGQQGPPGAQPGQRRPRGRTADVLARRRARRPEGTPEQLGNSLRIRCGTSPTCCCAWSGRLGPARASPWLPVSDRGSGYAEGTSASASSTCGPSGTCGVDALRKPGH